MLQKVNRARKDMVHEIGREPSVPELAHYIEMSVEELTKLTSRSRNVVSLEIPLSSGGSLKEDRRTIGDFIVSDAPTPEEDAQSKYLKHDIRAVIDELQANERDVVILRFGLDNGTPLSINQTSKRLGISSDRVRTVEARALTKLRSPQRNYRLKEYLSEHNEEAQPKEDFQPSPEKMWFF
jgi:RNA polymerase primary sigma factor